MIITTIVNTVITIISIPIIAFIAIIDPIVIHNTQAGNFDESVETQFCELLS